MVTRNTFSRRSWGYNEMILVQKERIVVFMMMLRYGTVLSISTLKRVAPTFHGENGSSKSAVSSLRHHKKIYSSHFLISGESRLNYCRGRTDS